MMRALVMDYAADKKASRLNDEYLFGRNILVKPVTILYTPGRIRRRRDIPSILM